MSEWRFLLVVFLATVGGSVFGIITVHSKNHVFCADCCRAPAVEMPGVYICGPKEFWNIVEDADKRPVKEIE